VETRLCRLVGQAIADYRMIEDGDDRVMVCLSGGKDSYGLLEILLSLRSRAPIHFDIIAVNLDQKQPGFPAHVLPEYLTRRGVPFHIETRDTYSIVKRLIPEGTDDLLALLPPAPRPSVPPGHGNLGATKIALGHHRDDILETLLLESVVFTGKMKAMPPKLAIQERTPCGDSSVGLCEGSRPGALCRPTAVSNHPLRPMRLAGRFETSNRSRQMLQDWNQRFPGSNDSMFAALGQHRALAAPGSRTLSILRP
jgi:tRNA 2-thiocytidine biosynthesis protein TtcA